MPTLTKRGNLDRGLLDHASAAGGTSHCFPNDYITFKARIGQELKGHVRRLRLSSFRGGYALVVLSAFCFATAGVAIKALFRLGYSAQSLAQLRIWWAFAWLLGLLLAFRPSLLKVSRRDLPALAIFGGVGLTGVQLTYYLSIARINIAVALLVQYLGLVAVTTWEHHRRRETVGGQVWAALAMVLVGAFLAVGAYQPSLLRINLPGVAWGLVSAGFFAFYILRASTLARRLNPWTILVYGFGTGSALWLAYDTITLTPPPTGWKIWAIMALVGFFGTGVGHALFVVALRVVRPSSAGIVATAEPVFAGLIAWLFLADHLQALQLAGAAIILAGIIIVQLTTREPSIAAPVLP